MRVETPKSLRAASSPTDRMNDGRSMVDDYPPTVDKCNRGRKKLVHPSWTSIKNQQLTIPHMDYKAEIGRRIREGRDAKGWTLEELSERTGGILGKTRISGYENGDKLPGPETVALLAEILGRRPAYMMCMEDKQEEALVRNWRTLSEKDRMEIFRKLEALAMANRDPVPDYKVEHMSAKGKPMRPVARAKVAR